MICALVENLFDLYLDGRLAAFQARWVESHIASCPKCATELKAWKQML
ncbi:MAG: zf-HC2 domain-containing protein, partial [Elusimicrobiota bacterium]